MPNIKIAKICAIVYNQYMNILKKTVLALAIMFFVLTFLSLKPKTQENEVVFWTLQLGTFDNYMNPLIQEFERENPGIKIKWIDVPYSEGEKRTLASILSNTPPDLVNLTPEFSSVLAQKQALYYIDCEKLSAYNAQIVKNFMQDGKCYAVPFYATSALNFYNKDLFAKSKIKKLPQTYTDLFEISAQIKQNTGVFSTMPTLTENDTLLKILNKYGVNSPQTLTNEASMMIFDGYKGLYQKDLIPKESITQTHREALEKFMSGQLVFIQSGANFLNMVKDNAPGVFKVTDVTNQLTGKSGKYDVSIMNLIIPQRAKNKEAALKFALFLTNKKNQVELAKLTTILPVNNYALNDEYFTKYDEKDVISKARCLSAKQLENLENPVRASRNQKEIITLLNTSVQEIMLDKAQTCTVLEKTSKLWKDLLNNE